MELRALLVIEGAILRIQTAHTTQQCDTSLAAGPAALTADALSNTI
jgi:hypothetical protein